MNSRELRELLNKPPEPGFDFIEDHRRYEAEIINGYKMDVTNYGILLDKYCPYKQGQLVTIVGHPNAGKTTIQIYLGALLAKRGKRGLVWSGENRISVLHKNFARFAYGTNNVTQEHLEGLRKSVKYIVNKRSFNYKEIIEQAMYLLDAGFDWDWFLIDPYNGLSIHNPDRLQMHDYHYMVADYFRLFCMNANKTIFLNCHTLTESQREKLDANGERKAPMASFVEGGAKFINKSDDVMVYHRNPKSKIEGKKYVTEIHVDKVRNQEFGGEQTRYDEPIEMRFRIDYTGFDVINSQPSPSIKQTSFYEKEVPF
jgi:energy-coupling factor transporter ATP-binding protein EcfA2